MRKKVGSRRSIPNEMKWVEKRKRVVDTKRCLVVLKMGREIVPNEMRGTAQQNPMRESGE